MKSKGHILSANLLRDELIKNNGYLLLEEYEGGKKVKKSYKIPDMFYRAIKNCPTYFRGGSVGPDFFPDIFEGQSWIHPKNSGKWLSYMQEKLLTYSPGDSEFNEALAFYLGYMIHYAGDMFTHDYVNDYAGGPFPEISNIIDSVDDWRKVSLNNPIFEKIRIIIIHLAIETYLDNLIGYDNPKDDFRIDIPISFLRTCFATRGAIEETNVLKMENGAKLEEINKFNFLGRFVYYYERLLEKNAEGGSVSLSDITEREEYIEKWLKIWGEFTQRMIDKGLSTAWSDYKADFINLLANYLCNAEGDRNAWEFASSVVDAISGLDISIPIFDEIGELVEECIEDKILLPYVRPIAAYITRREPKYIDDYDEAIESIKDHFIHPAKLFLSLGLNDLQKTLEKEWNKFWRKKDCFDQPFPVFKRCLNMGKLCLLGTDNINKIIDRYYEERKEGQDEYKKDEIRLQEHTLQWSLHEIKIVATTAKTSDAGTKSKIFFGLKTRSNKTETADKGYEVQLNRRKDGLEKPGGCEHVDYILPSVVPISSIEAFTLRLAGNDQWIAENIYVIDVRTGIMLAKASNIKLSVGKTIKIGILGHLEDAYCQLQDGSTRINTISGLMVTIRTSSDFGSGTDGDVIFKMETTHRNVEQLLDKESYNDFEMGDLDTYYFQIRNPVDYNEIKNFYIKKEGGSDWKPAYITVCDSRTGICMAHQKFNRNITSKWSLIPFDRTLMDNFLKSESNSGIRYLQVVIKTSNDLWSGTDDNVYMEIKFDDSDPSNPYSNDKYKAYLNTAWHNDFERGDIDTFNVDLRICVKKSSIKSFEFFKKGSDDWKVEWIKISDSAGGEVLCYEENIDRKLKSSEDRIVISSGYWNKK
ncbi:PLAT/LH2 domain-containing protein [Acetivibrio mesophilus]|uniref:PLAT domain-containing protein n=1 Tax=Acetivibrio mesophilus TaxID=2487273 RepID=A0A4Q0I682_9FIRM|nr:PLAT/LH2 domain-containing protein [Acetivibrio mesophilus]ODM25103.1 hypothetical protein A7W90_02060 [Clostridium sp. Bc-iso-3]RXE59893.1 hypothetical protein EFD62_03855 [Acetivibrio mesophilus]HHV29668.1 hypothetical protein [Clostridium sp.]